MSTQKPNTFTHLSTDADGARRHSSFRYVDDGGYFLLWGYLSYDVYIYGGPHIRRTDNPEYDSVIFDPKVGTWQNQFPLEKEDEWGHKLPPMYPCQLYHGITTGSYRPQLKMREGVLRPDLNIVFDQVTYDKKRSQMVYFTGGRTFAYRVVDRTWSDIGKGLSPPPVLGGSLCMDPFNDEIVLVGGGHVAETGPDGQLVGYTGTWIYDCVIMTWQRLMSDVEPPPRMATRLVCDTRNEVLVLFGGDAQTHFLADTWIYDTRIKQWRVSKALGGPPARAGHFTVYDPNTGWVIIGGGYNRDELTDMWAYSALEDRWMKLNGETPVGWYITADIKPDEGLIICTTATKSDQMMRKCDELFLVRSTYAFEVDPDGLVDETAIPTRQEPIYKRSIEERTTALDVTRREEQKARLQSMPNNTWTLLSNPGRAAPLRTWGSCAFDTDRGQIIYWGGGHCGYGGNDYDFYDVVEHTWISSPEMPDYPPRAWNRGINLAGVTFNGAPWIRHGRKVYAYDPVSKKIINTKLVYLTAGYDPESLRSCAPATPEFGTGENFNMSGHTKWPTWSYDRETETWEIVCSGLVGLDLTVSTPHGVMAIDHNWGAVGSTDRADMVTFDGYRVVENAVYLLDVAGKRWKKLSKSGPWPQNLYEMAALIYDTKRDCLILHGAGVEQDELWIFDLSSGVWALVHPALETGENKPPTCRREAVYIPQEDVFFTCSYPSQEEGRAGVYVYHVGENTWFKADIAAPVGREMKDVVGQNRAMTFDPAQNRVMMVLGEGTGNLGNAVVYALNYSRK